MSSNYEAIKAKKQTEYGTRVGSYGKIIADQLYSEKTHFIYELLQNAEDAGATYISFELFEDRLEVTHDGRPFDDADVDAICSIGEGTKSDDLTKIGKFGIGFKSVFALTKAPRIYSGDEHFKITDYVLPDSIPARSGLNGTTLFVVPFDRPDIDAREAYGRIAERLRDLGTRTLLFLNKIEEISWFINGLDSGHYLRSTEPGIGTTSRRVTIVGDANETAEQWLVFGRPVEFQSTVLTVEIAFRLSVDDEGREMIERVHDPRLVVFFPTELETHFGFLIQGPFRTTPARDNIRKEHPLNLALAENVGSLVQDVFLELKAAGRLDVPALNTLWLDKGSVAYVSTWIFRPVYLSIVQMLQTREILPTVDGSWANSRSLRFARSAELVAVFSVDDLSLLLGAGTRVHWVHNEISRLTDLARFLRSPELGVEEVTPEVLLPRLSNEFLRNVSDEWLIRLYRFLKNVPAQWKRGAVLRNRPIVRLDSDLMVSPFDQSTGQPNAYLPGQVSSEKFPTVKRTLLEDEDARSFLIELGIKAPDSYDEIELGLLPKYQCGQKVTVTVQEYARDLQIVLDAYSSIPSDRKSSFESKLRESCIVLGQRADDNRRQYRRPGECFAPHDLTDDWLAYFLGNPEIWIAVEPDFDADEDRDRALTNWRKASFLFHSLDSVESGIRLRASGWYLSELHGWNRRAKFDFERDVFGLEHALRNRSFERAAFIWTTILIERGNLSHLKGERQFSTRKSFTDPETEVVYSPLGKKLTSSSWLPNREGKFCRPGELSLDDLPDEFERDEQAAIALGMKTRQSTEVLREVAELFGIPENDLEVIRSAPDELRKFIEQLKQKTSRPEVRTSILDSFSDSFSRDGHTSIEPADEIGEYPVLDPDRRQQRLQAEMVSKRDAPESSAPRNHVLTRQPAPKDEQTRHFLKEQYRGRCQICDDTFPRAKDGEPYFEAFYLIEQSAGTWFDSPANALCLCANHSAQFQHAAKHVPGIEDIVTYFREIPNDRGIDLPINLAGLDLSITFSQRHVIAIKAMLEEQ